MSLASTVLRTATSFCSGAAFGRDGDFFGQRARLEREVEREGAGRVELHAGAGGRFLKPCSSTEMS